MNRILYFFPLNPADNNTGSCRRALGLLQYFKDKGISVDFVSQEDWGGWTTETTRNFEALHLSDSLHVFKRKPDKINPISYFFSYKLWHNIHEQKLGKDKRSIPNHTTLHLQNQFNELFRKNKYDAVIISYVYWADIIRDNPLLQGVTTIVDTHDFLTSQHRLQDSYALGLAFADEIKRLNYFDRIWAIAPEEDYLFTQLLGNKVDYVPAFIEQPTTVNADKNIDLLYVAADNPHNLRSCKWLFEQVYPLLSKNITITVIGKIAAFVPKGLTNVDCIPYVDHLDEWYAKTKLALCPMLTGTGVKIKVIEAMANGLPVICTKRGLDGLPMRLNNGCTVADDPGDFSQAIIHLLNDEEAYKKQSMLAKSCHENCFSKAVVYKKLDEALNKALK